MYILPSIAAPACEIKHFANIQTHIKLQYHKIHVFFVIVVVCSGKLHCSGSKMISRTKTDKMEGQKETYPASNQQANRVRRSAELSGLIFCISNGKAAVSPSAGVTGYQSQARPRPPGGKHSLLCARQRSSSPLTHSMMGFKIKKKKEKAISPPRC